MLLWLQSKTVGVSNSFLICRGRPSPYWIAYQGQIKAWDDGGGGFWRRDRREPSSPFTAPPGFPAHLVCCLLLLFILFVKLPSLTTFPTASQSGYWMRGAKCRGSLLASRFPWMEGSHCLGSSVWQPLSSLPSIFELAKLLGFYEVKVWWLSLQIMKLSPHLYEGDIFKCLNLPPLFKFESAHSLVISSNLIPSGGFCPNN